MKSYPNYLLWGVINSQVEKAVENNKPEQGAKVFPSNDILATPVARRLAKEIGIDLNNILGTGPGGRIREEDVRKIAQENKKALPLEAKSDAKRKNKQIE